MNIIDTHTHIYGKEFTNDLAQVIQRAENEGVTKFYLPGIDSHCIPAILKLEEIYPGKCLAMMGLHPCSVNKNYQEELNIVSEWLAKRPFTAVGEIGLDFYWDKTFEKEQYEAFHQQIELSLQYNLPIIIHTRNAMPETIAVVRQYSARGLRGIFHCFGGPLEAAEEIISLGFCLGIGGVLTYNNAGLGPVLEKIDLKHLVLETDAPYLTPVPFRGKRNEPAYLKYIIKKLAEVKGITPEEVAAATTANATSVFAY